MTPLARYRLDLERPGFFADPEQGRVVEYLQALHDELVNHSPDKAGLLSRLGMQSASTAPLTGLYLWGAVGRGKTYLADLLFESLPFEAKQRTHFHRFMRRVHNELKTLRERRDPLAIVADRFAVEARVLCFDEFLVNDITDAMILGGLLGNLFARGVTLVATSNTAPDELYKDGLQHDRFLPAIELIKAHTRVVHLQGGTDYRLQFLEKARTYLAPAGGRADQELLQTFRRIAPQPRQAGGSLEIEGREIETVRLVDGVVWFEFDAICDGPRSQNDYVELASCFHTVVISNVPVFTRDSNDRARRFINLVDILYDRHVTLIVSAEAAPDELYRGGRLASEFRRTSSRLLEMQSRRYLSQSHLG